MFRKVRGTSVSVCCRRPSSQLVGWRSGWRTGADVLGRGSTRKPAVRLRPAGELCGPQTPLQLWRRPHWVVLCVSPQLNCLFFLFFCLLLQPMENYSISFHYFFCVILSLPCRANDSGLLTHKESLPVRSLVLGDVHRPGSESAYKVGHLRCNGDSKSGSRSLNVTSHMCQYDTDKL